MRDDIDLNKIENDPDYWDFIAPKGATICAVSFIGDEVWEIGFLQHKNSAFSAPCNADVRFIHKPGTVVKPSIHSILKEAYDRIKSEHGVALQCVYYRNEMLMSGNYVLCEIEIDALPIPKS